MTALRVNEDETAEPAESILRDHPLLPFNETLRALTSCKTSLKRNYSLFITLLQEKTLHNLA
jgi:hypothetical protein